MYEHINLNKVDEVVKLLRGIYPLIIHEFDCGEPLPTNISAVLTDFIYKNPANNRKEIFQKALLELINGSAADVFLAVTYINGCLYYEHKNDKKIASFSIDIELFIPLIKESIKNNIKELEDKIVYVNGTVYKQPINRLKVLDKWFKKDYGFSIL